MSKKPQFDQPADDLAGLAQNLFGINLDKATGDEDLLDEDMFKVELPKPPEMPVSIPQSDIEFAPEATTDAVLPSTNSSPVVAEKPPVKSVPQRAAKACVSSDELFGFGIVEEVEAASTSAAECATPEAGFISDDDGLTLPDDSDAEGLTLPADYDDGLTLAPEGIGAILDDADRDEEDEESDTEVLSPDLVDAAEERRPEPRRRRQPRRTREDAYWDLLENWEWEEIPETDSPRAEGERPRSQRGDRGDRGGRSGRDRGRRDRGRDERPGLENRSSADQRPSRDEHRPAEAVTRSGNHSGERPPRPRRGDRPRDDRGPREDRSSGERRSRRDDRRPGESGPIAPANQPAIQSAATSDGGFDDFGSGIFDEQPKVTPSSSSVSHAVPDRKPLEESVAQSSQAADAVLKDQSGLTGGSIDHELVWPDEDSDVRPTPAGSVLETSRLPPAEAAGESDEMVSASDVEPLDKDDAPQRRSRRRRRRREPRSESRAVSPEGNEGTKFDLTDAWAAAGESPDFIPSAVVGDSAVSDGFAEEIAKDAIDADRPSSESRSGSRRRRRRRPAEGPASDGSSRSNREPITQGSAADVVEAVDGDAYVVTPIAYSNIPSWEDAIKYLLQPQLVGRNLGPDDADESLQNDPRGSGGAEPTPPPPPPQRRRGGGRGRRS